LVIMKVEPLCDSVPGPTMVYASACGSNVGQLANEGARRVALEGKVKMACLPGIGIRMETSIQAANKAKRSIVVDGCEIKCGKKILEMAGFVASEHVIVTQLGIVKNLDLRLNHEDIEKGKGVHRSPDLIIGGC
jgi:uncharacterized metal-binding protein